MDQSKSNIPASGVPNELSRSKSLSPAILGVPNYHGLKLPSYMTSEAKKKLSTILEERRKARVEKLAASILAKGKQIEKGKTSLPVLKPGLNGPSVNSKVNEFPNYERLKIGKAKQAETNENAFKPQISKINLKTTSCIPLKIPSEGSDLKKNVEQLKATTEPDSSQNKQDSKILNLKIESVIESEPVPAVEGKNEVRDKMERNDSSKGTGAVEIEKANYEPATSNSFQVKQGEKSVITNVGNLQIKPNNKTEFGKKKNSLRRSISMIYREKRKTEFLVRRSISAKNLNEISSNYKKAELLRPSNVDRAVKNDTKSVTFLTPRNKNPLTSTHLRTKLEDWLKNNGHSLDGYRHLRCFGVSESEKSTVSSCDTVSTEDFPDRPTTPKTCENDSDKENATPPATPPQMDVKKVENWLKELHRLIVELKYPWERCEEWLAAIRKRCGSCTQLPIYWECLAALHESKGDLKSAIEDYERAIIKGGEVDEVGNSLAQLFDKMVIEQKKCPKRKLEKGLDPKNIFKSTIIKFALQQKALKKLSSEMEPGLCKQLYVATPVRRSSRIQTPYKSKEEVSSLQTLTPELLKTVTFKPNQSLLGGD